MRMQCSVALLLLGSNAVLTEAFIIPTPTTSNAVSRRFRLNTVKEFNDDCLQQFSFMEKPSYLSVIKSRFPNMSNLKPSEAIVLAAVSLLVARFTDLSGGYERADLPWMMALCFSSISPCTISHLYRLFTTSRTSSSIQSDRRRRSAYSSPYQTRFILHEVVHNFTACAYHAIPMPIFVWMAMLNFPLWFGQLDLAISNKEQLLASGMMSSKAPNKAKHDPLLVFGMLVYSYGCISRGISYILSASFLVPLTFPFMNKKREFDFSVALNMIPMFALFLLEHMTIMHGMDNMHNAVHTLSHYAVHRKVRDLYVNHVVL
jgi:hypothetical protein